MNPGDLMTKAQVAELLAVSETTVERLIRGGQLRAYRIGPHCTRLDREEVLRYVRSREIKVAAARRSVRVLGPKDLRRGGVDNSGYYPGMKVVDPRG